MGYIQQYWTGPPILASLAKCMTKCTITVKNEGGNIFSNSHNVTAILFSRPSSSFTFNTLEHISLKKQDNTIKTKLTFFGKHPRIAIGKSCYIKMWLSWLFKPTGSHLTPLLKKSLIYIKLVNEWVSLTMRPRVLNMVMLFVCTEFQKISFCVLVPIKDSVFR